MALNIKINIIYNLKKRMTAKAFIETLKIIGQDYSGEIQREIFSLAKRQIPVFEVVKLKR
jgi:hypothetical protein